jgi:hypothetical protein
LLGSERAEEAFHDKLSKIAGAVLMSAGLSTSAFAAEADTERGQTPAAPAAAGADNQPNDGTGCLQPAFSPIAAHAQRTYGAVTGPDLARLAAIRSIASGREIYAAGGVRDAADLSALKAAGASGTLITTALHERRVVGVDLEAI